MLLVYSLHQLRKFSQYIALLAICTAYNILETKSYYWILLAMLLYKLQILLFFFMIINLCYFQITKNFFEISIFTFLKWLSVEILQYRTPSTLAHSPGSAHKENLTVTSIQLWYHFSSVNKKHLLLYNSFEIWYANWHLFYFHFICCY